MKPMADGSMTGLAAVRSAGVIAVLRAPSEEAALCTVDALLKGGITGVEVTYTTPGTLDVIRELRHRYGASIMIGAGTVLTANQARDAVEAGAHFLVSPGTVESLSDAMLETGVTVFLGALTPSEVMSALRLGAHAVKLFPSSLGGPDYLKALRAPFPDVPFMPTGGVNSSNLRTWFDAGAIAVGAGGELCPPRAMTTGAWDVIEKHARQFSEAFASVTKES